MNAALQTALPEHLALAASPQLAENSRLGFGPVASTSHWGFSFSISSSTLSLSASLYDGRVRPRSTGKERDAESGNDYFGARYYASAMGRWMSPDWSAKAEPVPYADLEDPQSLNLYAYVRNNPLDKTDPDGHCPICAYAGEIAGGAAVGALIGGGVEVVASLATHQDVTWANVKGAMVQGAITGSIAAATEGASLVSQGAAQAGANIVGGMIGRKISGAKTTATDVVVDGVSGAISPKLGKAMGAKLSKMVGNKTAAEAESKMGSKLGSRHAASVAKQVAAAQSSEKTAGAVANAGAAVGAQSVEKKVDQH